MIAKLFDTPVLENGAFQTLASKHKGDTNRLAEYTYTKRWTKPGDFELTLPFDTEVLSMLTLNGFICFDDGTENDWLWIQNLTYDGKSITLSGKDCKGLLETRIALYGATQTAGAEGYDVVEGTTAQCMKHYLDHNCTGLTGADAIRNLPVEWVGGADGLGGDSYMARFEYLSTIFTEKCDGAGIGYDIRGDLNSASGTVPFKVYTLNGTARNISQSVNPRVIFSLRHRNVITQSFEHGVSDLYNAIYATGTDEVTLVTNRGNTAASGIARRECNVSVSVATTDDWYSKYALDQVSDNIENHGYNIEVDGTGYGTDYTLGDKVTVLDDYTGNYYNAVITEVTKHYSASEKKLTLTLGEPKQKPLNRIVNSFLSGTARKR